LFFNSGAKHSKKDEEVDWYQLYVKIKHFNCEYYYSLERKIFVDNFNYESPTARKWYFIDLPLK